MRRWACVVLPKTSLALTVKVFDPRASPVKESMPVKTGEQPKRPPQHSAR